MEESLSDPAALPAPGATLLLPAVTVGNVGQLAIDLLVQSTVGSRRIGSLQSATVVPVTGGCAFSSADGALHGPARELELYVVDGKLVLQQRAPALPGCQRRFARELADWIESKGIEKVREGGEAPRGRSQGRGRRAGAGASGGGRDGGAGRKRADEGAAWAIAESLSRPVRSFCPPLPGTVRR